jgi:hypothetical protein
VTKSPITQPNKDKIEIAAAMNINGASEKSRNLYIMYANKVRTPKVATDLRKANSITAIKSSEIFTGDEY